MNLKLLSASTLLVFSFASAAVALEHDRLLIRSLQNALNDYGLDAGVADGTFGKKTQTALNDFRKQKNRPNNETLTMTLFVIHTIINKESDPNLKARKHLKQKMEGTLIDPKSAIYYWSNEFTKKDGVRIICGEINSKNSYGGYVGRRKFFTAYMEVEGDFVMGDVVIYKPESERLYYYIGCSAPPLEAVAETQDQ